MTTPVDIPCAATGCTNTPTVQWRRRSAEDPDTTDAVHACNGHAIGLELAAHVHAPICTAPGDRLPACDCTPEPIPDRQPQQADTPELPPAWGGQTGGPA